MKVLVVDNGYGDLLKKADAKVWGNCRYLAEDSDFSVLSGRLALFRIKVDYPRNSPGKSR